MSTMIPSAVKAADVVRFAHRAGQLEKARPAVAYWCNYWIVEQIISKGLHQADEESKSYTMQLMDKLEQTKVDFADNDAIVDEVAGHAYVEQFGLETFQRADNAMRADKVTRQTADTFQAAATFLELCQIWGPLDPEQTSKIKFAKYHALRIAKAIKAGEDPNMSNPKPDIEASEAESSILKPEGINDNSNGSFMMPQHQPSVEDTPEPVSREETQPSGVEHYYQQPPAPPEVSPLLPSSPDINVSQTTGYFPDMPQASPEIESSSNPPYHAQDHLQQPSNALTREPTAVLPPDLPSPVLDNHMTIDSHHIGPPPLPPYHGSSTSVAPAPPNAQSRQPTASHLPMQQPMTANPTPAQFRDDEHSVMIAQKHAKFAISALNFEDVPTAVRYLREALEALGAS